MRAESLVRSVEKTDCSTSSTSICERLGHLLVAVDDLVADGVDHGRRAVGEHGCLPSSRVTGRREPAPPAVADGDDELVADEDADLAGLDGVVLVDVPERLQHDEQRSS